MKAMKIKAKRLKRWDAVRGLIGKPKAKAIYFETRFGIHTFGLKFPIDILVLDDSLSVVKLKESLTPNRVFFWNPKYFRVVELPEGFVQRFKLKVRDKIILK